MPEKTFRLWDFQEIDDRQAIQRYRYDNNRPRYFLDPNESMEEYAESSIVRFDRTVYLEMAKLGANGEFELDQYNRESKFYYFEELIIFDFNSDDTLAFLKFFNHQRNRTEFKGTLILNVPNEIEAHFEQICKMIGQPPDTQINIYIVNK